jgi:hypothetical protein
MDLTMMERVGDRWGKMEGSCSTGQSPQWAVVPVEEEGGGGGGIIIIIIIIISPRNHGSPQEVFRTSTGAYPSAIHWAPRLLFPWVPCTAEVKSEGNCISSPDMSS